jgi:hypothetical protein
MLSGRKVTREVKLALFHLNHGLLVTIALGYSGVRSLLLGLDPPRVWALIGIMPWLQRSKCEVEVPLAWRLVAEPDGTENFPKACAGTESFSNGLMRMIGRNHAHSS